MLMKDCGLVKSGKGLAYGKNHGKLKWLPFWVQSIIVSIWNHITCTLYGHTGMILAEPGKQPECTNCCKVVKKFDKDKVLWL